MTKSDKPAIPVSILLFVGILAISFSSIFVRWSDAPVSIQAMYRLLITAVIMIPFGWKHRRGISIISIREWMLLAVSGIMLAVHFLLWMGSLNWTSVASSTIILAMQPIFVMIGAFILFRERTRAAALAGMAIAFLGVFLLMGAGIQEGEQGTLTGDVMSFLGTLAVAIHMLLGQMLLRKMHAYLYSWFVFVIAAASLAVYNLLVDIPFTVYSLKEWGIFLLLAVVPTVFGHLLFNWLMTFSNASTISMSVLGEPVGASLLAFLLLDEAMNVQQFTGGAVVLCGLLLFLRQQSRARSLSISAGDADIQV
ncbi:DMT family transporter [Paenibacillus lemnae]|uniref:DMT family transporter n=1 Tax=Paenibacillus lemnae TaxID=1330551 RepID=A0A848M542_PAELE|nr:DMT family transporter [Paenibacillus lemnae]NMO95875.1 DMT family transporter [Paenibacillus lemnae]